MNPQRRPPDDVAFGAGLRLLDASRQALLDLVAALAPGMLEFRPDPTRRSIRQILEHLDDAEALNRVHVEVPGPGLGEPW